MIKYSVVKLILELMMKRKIYDQHMKDVIISYSIYPYFFYLGIV